MHVFISIVALETILLQQAGMDNAKAVVTPGVLSAAEQDRLEFGQLSPEDHQKYKRLVHTLLYFAVKTRFDLFIATSIMRSRVANSSEVNSKSAKSAVRILQDIKRLFSVMAPGSNIQLSIYVDAS